LRTAKVFTASLKEQCFGADKSMNPSVLGSTS
jgi:hypothetical protein